MASINDICKKTVDDSEHSLALGIVDLSSGLLLAVHHTTPYFTQSYLDAVAAAAVDMFRGQAISAVEAQYSESENGATNTLQEAQLSTIKTYHFMSVIPEKQNTLVILITNKNIELKAGWAILHAVTQELTPLCP